jgi:ADP-ribose pyrophosphatase YjhB (NUDIX family)
MQQSDHAVSNTGINLRPLNQNAHLRVAVKALISRSEDDLLLVRRSFSTESANSLKYNPPGGAVEPGESLKTALKRKVSVETGLDISIGSIFGVSEWAAPWRNTYYVGVFFVCNLRTSNQDISLSPEHSEYLWCSTADLPGLDIMRGSDKIVKEYFRRSSTYNLIIHPNHDDDV